MPRAARDPRRLTADVLGWLLEEEQPSVPGAPDDEPEGRPAEAGPADKGEGTALPPWPCEGRVSREGRP